MIESYELVPEPVPPRLPGTVIVRQAADDAIDAAAADLLIHSRNCVRTFGDFHLAISVSPPVEPMLRRLMYDPPLREIPWKRTHLWLVDEHLSPGPSRPANFDLLFGLIVEQSDMPPEQAHAVTFTATTPPWTTNASSANTSGGAKKATTASTSSCSACPRPKNPPPSAPCPTTPPIASLSIARSTSDTP